MRRRFSWAKLIAAAGLAAVFGQPAAGASWTETPLYSFQGPPSDGLYPRSKVVFDHAGNLYGTTSEGGSGQGCGDAFGCGALFKLTPDGSESILYSWCKDDPMDCADGADPMGDIVVDSAGDIFGITRSGEPCTSCAVGAVFKVKPGGGEKVLHYFECDSLPCGDGSDPEAGLIMVGKTLYGTTHEGGGTNFGIAFSMSLRGSETVLHSFCQDQDTQTFLCIDGAYPSGTLARDGNGNLYGTTAAGGNIACNYAHGLGCGTVFKIAADGTFSVLHAFAGGADGATPLSNIVIDRAGNLYGSTLFGGGGCSPNVTGCGTIFRIAPDGTETVLHAFELFDESPIGDLLIDRSDNIYGTTGSNYGTIFEMSSNGRFKTLHAFCSPGCAGGDDPGAGLTLHNGALYGTAAASGAHNSGVVYMLTR